MPIMIRICSFAILFTANFISAEITQCEYESCVDVDHPGKYIQHTMCLYPPGPSAQCTNVTQERLDESEETMLLDLHNELRRKVASGNETRSFHGRQPAGKLLKLYYDKKLAEIAQRWADQCRYRQDTCRNFGGYRIGQNVGFIASGSQMRNFSEVIEEWSNEVEQFDPRIINSFYRRGRHSTDHYTQMIWGNTTRIGCGGVKYINLGGRFTAHLVCNYFPEGNIDGDAVYETIHQS